jgi:lipopolysaccharide export system ATP-binding protein
VTAPRNSHNTLAARGLKKTFGTRTVVNNIDIDLAAGEVAGLLGPNGAGKTTTFYMVVGLCRPDSGEITMNGEPITRLPVFMRARKGLSYLPQEPSVFRQLTVEQNLLAILETIEETRELQRQRAEELMNEFRITHIAKSKGYALSGGERRRVEIARALAAEPRFVLLDEPFAGVDPISVLDIQRIIRHLASRGIGILITDHNVRETLGICGRAYILNDGAMIAEGTPGEILANQQVRQVYLGEGFRL